MEPTGKQLNIAPGLAVQRAAFHGNWQFICTEEAVGRHSPDNYAYCELVGPAGHLVSDQFSAFIGYLRPGSFHPVHHHPSQELHIVLAGHAFFKPDGDGPATLGPAAHKFHASQQLHAMTRTDSAILSLVLWRGPDLTGLPHMVRADN